MKRKISIALVLMMLFTSINPLWAGNSKRELAQSNDVRVTDVKIIRGELVGGWFQAIEEVDELTVGDIFVIEVEVTNYGSETVHVLNLYDWDLSPQNRVGIIGTPSYCLGPIELQPSESATLYPFCLSQAFEAEGEGWVTISIYVDDWNFNRLCEDTFSFRIVVEEKPRVKFKGTAECDEYEVYDEYGNYVIGAWVDEILEDPQGKLAVGDFVHVTYQESHSFKQGDCIEAYGTYVEEEWGPVIVVGGAYGSPGDYIKKCDTIPPSITNIRESNDPINKQGCPEPTTVTIRADVSDPSGLAWVKLYYQPPGGSWTYRTMSHESGNTYKATIGPFSEAGTVYYYIKAWDEPGNSSKSSTYTVTVSDCEQCEGGWDVYNVRLNGGGTSITVNPGDPVRLRYNFKVWNGTADPGSIKQILAGLVKGSWHQVIDDCAYHGIPGKCEANATTGSFDYTFSAPTTPGTYQVVVANDAQYTCSAAKNNFPNQSTKESVGTVIVEEKGRPDLVITDITWAPTRPKQGEPVTFTVYIKNQGNASTGSWGPFDVQCYINIIHNIGSGNIDNLAAGSTTLRQFIWTPSKAGRHLVTAHADHGKFIPESNEDNNEKTKDVYVRPACPCFFADFAPAKDGFKFQNFGSPSNCLGMSLAAWDYSKYDREFPKDPQGQSYNRWEDGWNLENELQCYIVWRQDEWKKVDKDMWIKRFLELSRAKRNAKEYKRALASIKEGEPVVIGLWKGLKPDGHAVLAYEICECRAEGDFWIFVYDSNMTTQTQIGEGALHLTGNIGDDERAGELSFNYQGWVELYAESPDPLEAIDPEKAPWDEVYEKCGLSKQAVEGVQASGYKPQEVYSGSLDEGASSDEYLYVAWSSAPFAVSVNWKGSTFKLSLYRPDGSLYEEKQSSSPPLMIEVPSAEPGKWTFKVTAVDVPHGDYPYVAVVGTKYQIYLPLILKNYP